VTAKKEARFCRSFRQVIASILFDKAGAEQEFLREARQLAKLNHPGIVSVFDVGVDGGRCTRPNSLRWSR